MLSMKLNPTTITTTDNNKMNSTTTTTTTNRGRSVYPRTATRLPWTASDSNKCECVLEVLSQDVLLGRGSGPNDHEGNIKFRDLINGRKPEYLSTNHRQTKALIAKEIVDKVYQQGGRFLKKLNSNEAAKRLPKLLQLADNNNGLINVDHDHDNIVAVGNTGGDFDSSDGPRAVYQIQKHSTVMEKAKQALRQNQRNGESLSPTTSESPTNSRRHSPAAAPRGHGSSNKISTDMTPPHGIISINNDNNNNPNFNNWTDMSMGNIPTTFNACSSSSGDNNNNNSSSNNNTYHQQYQGNNRLAAESFHIPSSVFSSSQQQQQDSYQQQLFQHQQPDLMMSLSSLQQQQDLMSTPLPLHFQQQQQMAQQIANAKMGQMPSTTATSTSNTSSQSIQYEQQQQLQQQQLQQQKQFLQEQLELQLRQLQQHSMQHKLASSNAALQVAHDHQHQQQDSASEKQQQYRQQQQQFQQAQGQPTPPNILNGYATYTTTLDAIEDTHQDNRRDSFAEDGSHTKEMIMKAVAVASPSGNDKHNNLQHLSSGSNHDNQSQSDQKSMQMSTMMGSFKDLSVRSNETMQNSSDTIGTIDDIPGGLVGGFSMGHMSGISIMTMMNDSTDSLYKSAYKTRGDCGVGAQNASWGSKPSSSNATASAACLGLRKTVGGRPDIIISSNNNNKNKRSAAAAAGAAVLGRSINLGSGSGCAIMPPGGVTGRRSSAAALRTAQAQATANNNSKGDDANNNSNSNTNSMANAAASAMLAMAATESHGVGGILPNNLQQGQQQQHHYQQHHQQGQQNQPRHYPYNSNSNNNNNVCRTAKRNSFGTSELLNDAATCPGNSGGSSLSLGFLMAANSNSGGMMYHTSGGTSGSISATGLGLSSAGGSSNLSSFRNFCDSSLSAMGGGNSYNSNNNNNGVGIGFGSNVSLVGVGGVAQHMMVGVGGVDRLPTTCEDNSTLS